MLSIKMMILKNLFIQILFIMLTITRSIITTSNDRHLMLQNGDQQLVAENSFKQLSNHNQMFIKQLLSQVSNLSSNKTSNVNQNNKRSTDGFKISQSNSILTTTTSVNQQQRMNIIRNNNNQSFNLVKQKWLQMEKSIGNSLELIGFNLKSTIVELIKDNNTNNISLYCEKSLINIADGLIKQQLWASQFVDASARLPAGLLEGTLTELGNFDQCLSIKSTMFMENSSVDNNRQYSFNGQYCSFIIKPILLPRPRLHTFCQRMPSILMQPITTTNHTNTNMNMNQKPLKLLSQNSHQFYYSGLRLGICLPSLCSRFDIQKLLTSYLNKFELLGQIKSCQVAPATSGSIVLDSSAQQSNTFAILEQFDLVQQCIMLIFLILFLLTTFGTLFDFIQDNNTRKIEKFIEQTKSMNNNKKKTTTTTTDDTLDSMRIRLAGSSLINTTDCYDKRQNGKMANERDKKNWHYQMYGPHEQHQSLNNHNGSIGLQRNPLVAGRLVSTSSVSSSAALLKDHHEKLFGSSGSSSGSSSSSREQPMRSDLLHNITTQDDLCQAEEAWLAELEKNRKLMSLNCSIEPSYNSDGIKTTSIFISILICFSIRKSLASIGKHAKSSNNNNKSSMDDIKVIHGIRTLTMVWIIFGHTIGLVSPEMMNNLYSIAQVSCSSRVLQAMLNATLAVNTFFMISGLVTVISFGRRCKSGSSLIINNDNTTTKEKRKFIKVSSRSKERGMRNAELLSDDSSSCSVISSSINCSDDLQTNKYLKKTSCHHDTRRKLKTIVNLNQQCSMNNNDDFKPILWLVIRYLRLTPTYLTVIGLTILLPSLGSGPFWLESINQMGFNCRKRWWHNILYINNFLETDRLCLIHSWYLSNDFQFFILSLILFYLFFKSKRITLLLVVILILASSAATFAITVSNEFPPTIVTTSPAIAERWQFIYTLYYKPWPHLSSYLVGLIAGYMILLNNNNNQSTGGWLRYFLCFMFSLIAFSVLNSIYPWNMGLQVEPILTGLHSATFRTLWAISCSWLIYALSTSPNNPLTKLLSWHGFQISSRLTYCAYLIHPLIIYYHFGTLRERLDSSIYGQFHRFIATLGLSYLFALLLSLFIESPSIQLQNLILILCNKKSKHEKHGGKLLFYDDDDKSNKKIDKSKKQYRQDSGNNNNNNNNERSSESLTTNSWTVAGSSFDACEKHNNNNIIDKSRFKPICASDNFEQDQFKGLPMDDFNEHDSVGQEEKQPAIGVVQLDENFQKKLDQAISRGFRIRSKLAASSSAVNGKQHDKGVHNRHTIEHDGDDYEIKRGTTTNSKNYRANQIKRLPVLLTSSSSMGQIATNKQQHNNNSTTTTSRVPKYVIQTSSSSPPLSLSPAPSDKSLAYHDEGNKTNVGGDILNHQHHFVTMNVRIPDQRRLCSSGKVSQLRSGQQAQELKTFGNSSNNNNNNHINSSGKYSIGMDSMMMVVNNNEMKQQIPPFRRSRSQGEFVSNDTNNNNIKG